MFTKRTLTEIATIVAAVFAVLQFMKPKKKTWGIVWLCVFISCLVYMFAEEDKSQSGQTNAITGTNSDGIITTGSNSPAAIIKGSNSTINQNSPSTVAPQINMHDGNAAIQIKPINSPITQIITNAGQRTITKEQHDSFVNALKDQPKKPVWVVADGPSPEVGNVAKQMRAMLNDAGVGEDTKVPIGAFNIGFGMGGNGIYYLPIARLNLPKDLLGVICVNDASNPPPEAVVLNRAFTQSGINFNGMCLPTMAQGDIFVVIQNQQ
jgi:hypothetical protein